MRVDYALQYRCACVRIEPGDTFAEVLNECIKEGALCYWEGEEDLVVQFPGRPQEVYSKDALWRSLATKSSVHDSTGEPTK